MPLHLLGFFSSQQTQLLYSNHAVSLQFLNFRTVWNKSDEICESFCYIWSFPSCYIILIWTVPCIRDILNTELPGFNYGKSFESGCIDLKKNVPMYIERTNHTRWPVKWISSVVWERFSLRYVQHALTVSKSFSFDNINHRKEHVNICFILRWNQRMLEKNVPNTLMLNLKCKMFAGQSYKWMYGNWQLLFSSTIRITENSKRRKCHNQFPTKEITHSVQQTTCPRESSINYDPNKVYSVFFLTNLRFIELFPCYQHNVLFRLIHLTLH